MRKPALIVILSAVAATGLAGCEHDDEAVSGQFGSTDSAPVE